jgi:GntR family transcriptional regulator
MKFHINRKFPLSIKNQIKQQIKGLVHAGELLPGEPLPSSKDLSALLTINRNTVATVYGELVAEGFLTAVQGSGTFVNNDFIHLPPNNLKSLMDRTIVKARKMGFSSGEIIDQFFSALATINNNRERKKKVLLVWCNPDTLREVGEQLVSRLDVETEALLLDDLEKRPDDALARFNDKDLVVTSINYIDRILPFVRQKNVDVVGVMLTPVTRILNVIMRLPEGSIVGFCCVNGMAAESTCRSVCLSGNVTFHTIWAGADDADGLRKMFSRCTVIFATHHIYRRVCELADNAQQIVCVDVSLNQANMDLIRERLQLMEVR